MAKWPTAMVPVTDATVGPLPDAFFIAAVPRPRLVRAVVAFERSERLLASASAPILLAAVGPAAVSPVPPAATETGMTRLIVLPFFDRPVPAMISPAPLNWVKVSAVVPTVIGLGVVSTKPAPVLVLPCSTKVKMPLTRLDELLASVARVRA